MRARIVTAAGQKGGIGKTALLLALAVEWWRKGYRVLVIDADDPKQVSAATWSIVAAEQGHEAPNVIRVGADLRRQVRDLARGYDVVLIDTPGHLEQYVIDILEIADLALLPCSPGPFDVWTFGQATAPIVRAIQRRVETLDAATVLTCLGRGVSMRRHLEAQVEMAGIAALGAALRRRSDHEKAFAIGKAVQTYKPTSDAAAEVRELAREVEKRLGLTPPRRSRDQAVGRRPPRARKQRRRDTPRA